ncbi:ABC transporter transmembrane domain-containing protein [Actinocrispum wychmicini]|uniref:ABC-type multidrug transport system fused ATPase/permease subunit n=1 Tax=Actinocrispum wychmicini TaxID=1213861 RepID=A0A4R2JZV7_9PSEU|nr:ABC transporter ATP-binding protein [Actinocrispum wychmicini]TCO64907.1 ABC-type multidrug transport system fused ATPase/permease subunit [Actinocrispum wychmicini]
MVFGTLWMVPLALLPLAIGEAVDQGIAARDTAALLTWIGIILALGVVLAASTFMLTLNGDRAWLNSARLMQQTVIRHATSIGAALPQKIKTGEIVAVGASDLYSIAGLLEIIGRLTGSVVAFGLVATLLTSHTPVLGLVVLLGMPLATLGFMPLLKPLQNRTEAHREEVGTATAVAADIVSGLRVLRGIGGERQFTRRFAETSQRVRHAGVAASRVESWVAALALLLPSLVIALVTWLGARLALDGTITIGELVAFYGVSAFLIMPVGSVGEAVHKFNEAVVAARRACTILRLTPALTSPESPVPLPHGAFGLRDETSGITCAAGQLTVITGQADDLADRLGRYVDAPVLAGDVPLRDADLAEIRGRILVAHNQDMLFSGRLADEVDMGGTVDVRTALWAADAMDVVDGLADGLDEELAERGRTLSGGQRQRMMLARALSADADVLVLDEPTSAVDAHTEARIVRRVAELRQGRTTVVFSQSPLWTNVADKVYPS